MKRVEPLAWSLARSIPFLNKILFPVSLPTQLYRWITNLSKNADVNLEMDQHSTQGGLKTCFRLQKPGYNEVKIHQLQISRHVSSFHSWYFCSKQRIAHLQLKSEILSTAKDLITQKHLPQLFLFNSHVQALNNRAREQNYS